MLLTPHISHLPVSVSLVALSRLFVLYLSTLRRATSNAVVLVAGHSVTLLRMSCSASHAQPVILIASC